MILGSPIAVVGLSFAAMEGVSYATHRFVMHGFGWRWHRSHHAPPENTFERNDLFPVCFAAGGFTLFLIASVRSDAMLFWMATGISAYGAAYMVVHDVCIHRRVAVATPNARYLAWLRRAHAVHHRFGGEPYGMLLPVLSRAFRAAHPVPATGPAMDRSRRPDPTRGSPV